MSRSNARMLPFLISCLLVFFTGVGVLRSQQYNFLRYSVQNGLPQTHVNCVFQDADGFMWIGTEAGACRFDGNEFVTFDAETGLPGNEVTAIAETKDGILLATDSGIVVYFQGKLKLYKQAQGSAFHKIFSFFNGLNNEQLFATDNGVFRFENKRITKVNTGTPIDQLAVRVGYKDSKNNLWLGSESNGLWELQFSGGRYNNKVFSNQELMVSARIRGIVETEKGEIWIATSDRGLFSFDGHQIDEIQFPTNINIKNLTCAHKDINGDIWLGTWGGGVIRYTQSVFRQYSKKNGLSDDIVSSINSDRQGNLWFGTFSTGLILFYGDQFSALKTSDGLPDNNVRSITEDDAGNIWIATLNGIGVYDGVDIKVWNEQNGLSFNRVGALVTDGVKIFAGTFDGSINVIENGKVTIYRSEEDREVGEIISMLYLQDGSVLIGTVSNGLFRFVNNKIEFINTGNTLLRNPIWCLHQSQDGVIWIGTGHGMFYLEKENAVKPLASGRVQPFLPVYGIQSDKKYIYFSTQRNGLWRYDRSLQKYQVLTKDAGLASNFTRGVLFVDDKTSYVLSILGMDKIVFKADTQMVQHFLYSDGIGTDNFNPGAIFRSSDGKVFLGSTDGLIIYSPGAERKIISLPRVEINEVLLFNQHTKWDNYTDSLLSNGLPFKPDFPYDKNQLTFHLSGIQYGAGVNIRYEYRLKGFNKDTIELTTGNTISYTNLPPGNYKLIVWAINSSNVKSIPVTFAFEIKPPFYGTWWFFLIVISTLSFVGIVFVFMFRRLKTDFVRRHRSFNDYALTSGRFFLLIAGPIFPVLGFICNVFLPKLNVQIHVEMAIGLLLFISGLLSFFNDFIRKYIVWFSQLGYCILIIHVLYLCHLNNLNPVTVVMLFVVLGAGSLVLDNIRISSIFSGVLVIAVGVLMFSTGNEANFNKWILFLGVIISILIITVSLLSRLNLLNRLVFADTTINNSRSIVIAADENGKIIYASHSVKSVLGYSEEEVMGEGWWKIRGEDPEENKRVKENILENRTSSSVYTTAITAKNKSTKWIQWVDTNIDGGIKVGIGLDITDRKEIEERYRHIVESATDIIYTADHKGQFTYVNEVASKITGYATDELLGRHFTDVVRVDYVDEVRSFYAKQFSRRTVTTYLEFPIKNNSGETIWLGQTVRILFNALRPTIIDGFQAIARDITEKKRYEEELEKLSLVASETINGVLICDPDGKIEWVNEGFTRITGYNLEEVEGKLPGDVLAGDSTDASAISIVREQSKNAEGFHKEFLVYNKQGYEIWIAVSNTPITDEHGKVLKQIEIFNDITEKKRYEIQLDKYSRQLEALNAAKEQLLRSETVDEVVENVLASLVSSISYLKRSSVALFDDRNGIVNMTYLLKDGGNKLERVSFAIESFKSLPHLKQNAHFLVKDLGSQFELSESDKENIEAGIHCYLVMPLYAHGQLIGSLNIGSPIPDSISKDDIEMVREIADAMANSLSQLRYRGIIEQKNADISDSILYARRIQDAILPPEEMLRQTMGDLFVYYKPKDILSGDFYWAEERGDYTFLAVVDSTGHGVPGALLSLMGQNLLNQAVHERHLIRPAAILDYLNAGIQHTLNQYKSLGEIRDGMDISLCVFEKNSMKMHFAGAINPMYIIRDGMMIESKGNRFSIGSYFDNKMRPFTNQNTELQDNDMIYLFTDGYPDQFGGEEDRKLSHRKFRELLVEIHKKELMEQKLLLDEHLKKWMVGHVQTDDICVIGIRIKK